MVVLMMSFIVVSKVMPMLGTAIMNHNTRKINYLVLTPIIHLSIHIYYHIQHTDCTKLSTAMKSPIHKNNELMNMSRKLYVRIPCVVRTQLYSINVVQIKSAVG
jgi:hypothetical protein